MNRDRPVGNIFIYCDDTRHPKRVAVTNFHPVGNQWYEHSSMPTRGVLVGDELPTEDNLVGWSKPVTRSVYSLECRKCRGRGAVPVRADKLFAVLNDLAAHSVSEISLADIAASLARISM